MPIYMSKDSRKIYSILESFCLKHKLIMSNGCEDAIVCDDLIIKYFANPVINVLNTHTRKMFCTSAPKQRHASMTYWKSDIERSLDKQVGTHRGTISPDIEISKVIFAYSIINNVLTMDYSMNELLIMRSMIANNELDDIIQACNVSVAQNIRNIYYINGILDRVQSERIYNIGQIEQMNKVLVESDRLLDNTKNRSTTLDMAQVQFDIEQQIENMKLQQKLDEMSKNMKPWKVQE